MREPFTHNSKGQKLATKSDVWASAFWMPAALAIAALIWILQ